MSKITTMVAVAAILAAAAPMANAQTSPAISIASVDGEKPPHSSHRSCAVVGPSRIRKPHAAPNFALPVASSPYSCRNNFRRSSGLSITIATAITLPTTSTSRGY